MVIMKTNRIKCIMNRVQSWKSITSPDFRRDAFEDIYSGCPETTNISCSQERIIAAQTEMVAAHGFERFRKNI